jgi:hypothetical protein
MVVYDIMSSLNKLRPTCNRKLLILSTSIPNFEKKSTEKTNFYARVTLPACQKTSPQIPDLNIVDFNTLQ